MTRDQALGVLLVYCDGLDAAGDGRGYDASHENARLIIMAALEAHDTPLLPDAPSVVTAAVKNPDAEKFGGLGSLDHMPDDNTHN